MKRSSAHFSPIRLLTGSLLAACLLFSNLLAIGHTVPALMRHQSRAMPIDPASLWVVSAAGGNGVASNFNPQPVALVPQSFNIQNEIDNADNYSTITVPRGNYSITDSIKIYGRKGLRIVCPGGGSYVGSWTNGQTTFTWNGTSHDPMLEIINSGSITIEGCHFEAKNPNNSNYSNVGIDIDQRTATTEHPYGQMIFS